MKARRFWRAVVVVFSFCAAAKDHPDERLKNVTLIFVSGNNQAAEAARKILQDNKTCLKLASKAADADAVLDVAAESQSQGGAFGGMGARAWVASATLTLKSGDLVWSQSERFSDSPIKSGGKTAGELLVKRLAIGASCKAREK